MTNDRKNVTKKQIEVAREVNLVNFLRRYEPDNIIEQGNQISLKDHKSVKITISNDKFYRHSQAYGGMGALDFLVKVRDIPFVDAVKILTLDKAVENHNEKVMRINKKNEPNEIKKSIKLPPEDNNTNGIVKYLLSRGIDNEIIKDCIKSGAIYQGIYEPEKTGRKYKNAVFVGKNEKGVTKYACVRSLYGNYKFDAEGSDKRYGFVMPICESQTKPTRVCVFESPIDALSGATIAKQRGMRKYNNVFRLSLGGLSEKSLITFLKTNPEVKTINLCLDADEAGRKNTERIKEVIIEYGKKRGVEYTINDIPPEKGKDYNEMLMILNMNKEKTKIAER